MLAIAMAEPTRRVGRLGPRRARRPPTAESLRRTRGRSAIAGDAEHLLPGHRGDRAHDVFADPFADEAADLRPLLLVLDDRPTTRSSREQTGELDAAAARHGVR